MVSASTRTHQDRRRGHVAGLGLLAVAALAWVAPGPGRHIGAEAAAAQVPPAEVRTEVIRGTVHRRAHRRRADRRGDRAVSATAAPASTPPVVSTAAPPVAFRLRPWRPRARPAEDDGTVEIEHENETEDDGGRGHGDD